MTRMKRAAFALLLIAATAPACTQQAPPAQPPAPPGPAPAAQVTCTEPRPQACTRDYRPVCGTKRDGARQTYGNGCSACADAERDEPQPGRMQLTSAAGRVPRGPDQSSSFLISLKAGSNFRSYFRPSLHRASSTSK